MKLALHALVALLLISCGNPHLNDAGLPFLGNTPVLSDPFFDPEILNPDGGSYLSITTNKPSQNGTLGLRNPNKIEIETIFTIEKGDHFRWNGGTFPGTSGSCTETQSALKQCQLDIEFFSDVAGDYNDTLIITSFLRSKPTESKIRRIPLKGKRIAGDLQPPVVTNPDGGSVIDVSTNTSTTTIQVTQTNPNDDSIIFSYRFVKGENFRFNGGTFPGTNGNCSAEQLGSGSCSFDVEFFSSVPGRFTDELILTYALKSNPSSEKTLRVPLVGERRAPPTGNISVSAIGNRPSIDFGSQVIGSALRTDTIVVENTGNVSLNLSIALLGTLPFAITNNCDAVIAPQETCTVDVTYASTAVGSHTSQVRVTSSVTDGASKINTVALAGKTVEKPVLPGELSFGNIAGQDLDFGTADAGAETRKIVEVKNTGEGPVQLTTPSIAGESFSFSGGSFPGLRGNCGAIILPGTCSLEISFRPTKIGSFSGALLLPQSTGKTLSLNLTGKSGSDLPPVCYRVEEKVLRVRPGANSNGIVFPYLKSAAGTNSKLEILYGSATNNYVQSLNRYTVKDAQVYVSYDFPVIPSAEQLLAVEIDLDVTKVILDDYKDTESLCLTSSAHRLCSGREFQLASWQKLRNPNFWTPQSAPVNSLYEDDFRSGTAGCGNYTCFNLRKAYTLTSLFGLSTSQLRSYSGKSMHFVFSDDTRLRSLPSLKIRTRKPVACQ